MADPTQTTDAQVWAREFRKALMSQGEFVSEGFLTGWFANAIETGRRFEAMERDDDRVLEVYQDKAGEWRWRLVARRGNLPDRIIADSGEGYTRKWSVKRAARSVYPGKRIEVL